jgi:hypothetical protein
MRYPDDMSTEGGMKGNQHKITCPNCKRVFTAWRPDTAPAVKVKCYYCKTEVEDEAAKRPPVAALAPAAPAVAVVPAEPPTTTS